MKCKKCGIEITSEKIWNIHIQECKFDENETKSVDFSSLGFQELKKLASSKGINATKMKKEEIIEALRESEG